jgi:glycosyltransferase involved in cell wall biosynthesis
MKLLFIGGINLGNHPRGGEEYKNQLLITKINEFCQGAKVLDTVKWKRSPTLWFNLIFNLFFKSYNSVLISASSLSTYRLLILIGFLKPSILKKTNYLVIGGYFPEGIREKIYNWKVYRSLNNVIVEGELLKKILCENSELKNIHVLPNFKNFPSSKFNSNLTKDVFRFVYIGRISRDKGINEIFQAIELLKRENTLKFVVDFYGPMEDEFNFDNQHSNYLGYLDFQGEPISTYEKLAAYNCLLFPTYWKGEGFPGVLIDAFISGLPVIASDWNMNREIIEDNVNGYIVQPRSVIALVEKMKFVIDNSALLRTISERNFEKSRYYHIDDNWPKLINLLTTK